MGIKSKQSTGKVSRERIFVKGYRVIAFASGGSFLGAMVGQIPGAVLLDVLGAMFALVYNPETANAGGNV
jgi:FixJ family two-component response regulator